MGSPTTSPNKKRLVVTLLVVLAAGIAGNAVRNWLEEPLMDQDVTIGPSPAAVVAQPAPPSATAPGSASGPVTEAPELESDQHAEEVPAPAGPRESFGHRAGLHKVRSDLNLSASAALVIDQETGQVLLRKNGDSVLPIASLTKLMTAVVVTEARLPMDALITITDDDVDVERHSRSRLRVGTTLTRSEALRLALMSSENRAAHALGRTFPGGLGAFVTAMNRKARDLGMKSTTYVDPTGLRTGNQSTAHDLSVLAAAAARNTLLAGFSTTLQHEQEVAGGRVLKYRNSNRLVKSPNWDILLQKTGYIVEAGWCMVLDTRIGGHKLFVVLLDAGGASSRIGDAERIRRHVAEALGVPLKQEPPEKRRRR